MENDCVNIWDERWLCNYMRWKDVILYQSPSLILTPILRKWIRG